MVSRRRRVGRTRASSSTETTRKTAPSTQIGRPNSQFEPAAASTTAAEHQQEHVAGEHLWAASARANREPDQRHGHGSTIRREPDANLPMRQPATATASHHSPPSCGARGVSLSVWANAWLAGRAAPDDVLDALSDWAPKHSVLAYDAVAAGRTGCHGRTSTPPARCRCCRRYAPP